eukprot:1205240-Rhodomonas_salina.1
MGPKLAFVVMCYPLTSTPDPPLACRGERRLSQPKILISSSSATPTAPQPHQLTPPSLPLSLNSSISFPPSSLSGNSVC